MRRLEDIGGFPLVLSGRRRTVAININREGEVRVLAPLRVSRGFVLEFVESKRAWIERTSAKMRARVPLNLVPLRAEEGEEALVLQFERCFEAFALRFAARKPALKLRRMKTRWGSCSGGLLSGKVTLNLALAGLDAGLVEAVIFHELCHLVHKNHGRGFYALLLSFVPDYREKSRHLNKYRL